jgi:predicted ATPase
VTFLFTDIEGSTRLWQQDEEAMRAAVARHDEVLQRIMTAYGGEVFSTMGDGVAVAFPSASSAVAAALAAQHTLAEEPWPTATPVRVRMGLHTGEAEQREGDYFGTAVNRAARLMAVGAGGQVLSSAATAGLVDAEVVLVDLGEHRLRDLDRPLRVFQVGAGDFARLRSLDAFPGNLPAQLTSFVGRQRDLEVVAEALRSARAVTLTGTGGVGKTRVALQAAADTLPDYPDGAWLCELAAASDPDAMLQVVAIALGLAPRQDVSLAQAIAEFIGKKQLLVLLDNCEHLLDAVAELVESVLGACPGARVLATSREALDVAGERVVRLRSLAVPPSGATLEELAASDAARLFLERAEATGADTAYGADAAAAIVEICHRLDGIPLAIELAAARVIALAPADIAAHLDERFRLLTGGRRAAVERHHTLRATVDWSYSLLNETERRVFERLGVFPGAFDAAAAKAVVSGDGIEDWDVVDALTSLVAKSMLLADASATGSARYQMLETLRHYARERLDVSGESDDRRRNHARHFAAVAEEIGAGLRSANEHAWHERLQADLDNFRAAVSWGLDSAEDADGDLALHIIAHLATSSTWGATGVGAWAEEAANRSMPGGRRYRGAVLATAAINAFYRGDMARSRQLCEQAMREPPETGMVLASGPYISSAMFSMPDDLPALLTRGLAVLDAVHAGEWERAQLRCSFAGIAATAGALEMAETEAAAALALGRRLHYPYIVALALFAHALACVHSQPDAALAALDEYIGMVDSGVTIVLETLARSYALASQVRASRGDLQPALDGLREAIRLAHRAGDRPAMAFAIARAVFVLRSRDAAASAALSGVVSAGALAGQYGVLRWEHEWFQRTLDEIRVSLGSNPFEDAVARGAALTYDDAIASALEAIEGLSHR